LFVGGGREGWVGGLLGMWSNEREVKKWFFSERIYYRSHAWVTGSECEKKGKGTIMRHLSPKMKKKKALVDDSTELKCRLTCKEEGWTKQYI